MWDQFDKEAANEGQALKNANKIRRPKRKRSVNREDIVQHYKKDLLVQLNVVNGVPVNLFQKAKE